MWRSLFVALVVVVEGFLDRCPLVEIDNLDYIKHHDRAGHVKTTGNGIVDILRILHVGIVIDGID